MKELIENIKSIQNEIWWRTLSYILSAFFLIPNITMVMFLIYMGEYDFFSYDFFYEGIFGMKLFFLTTSLFLLITSISLFSFVLLFSAKCNGEKIECKLWFGSVSLTLLSVFFLFFGFNYDVDIKRVVFVIVLCLAIISHVSILIYHTVKRQFISLGVIAFVIIYLSTVFPSQSSGVISIGLRAFGVGGDLPITISNAQSGALTTGKLKLISPKFIYFIPSEAKGVASYSMSSVGYYIVEKN